MNVNLRKAIADAWNNSQYIRMAYHYYEICHGRTLAFMRK
jgi:hypothetical protein